jgi:hypothetical protein
LQLAAAVVTGNCVSIWWKSLPPSPSRSAFLPDCPIDALEASSDLIGIVKLLQLPEAKLDMGHLLVIARERGVDRSTSDRAEYRRRLSQYLLTYDQAEPRQNGADHGLHRFAAQGEARTEEPGFDLIVFG